MAAISGKGFLWSKQVSLNPDQSLYFGFQELDHEARNSWFQYAESSIQKAFCCLYLCASATETTYPDYPNCFSKDLSLSEDEYHKIIRFVQAQGYFHKEKNPFKGCVGAAATNSSILRSLTPDQRGYMVFASTRPIDPSHDCKGIVMNFVCVTEDDSLTTTHMGIFRAPLDFLDPAKKYRGLAMQLHGFAAQMALTKLPQKKYMVTKAISSMGKVFSNALGSDLHMGTNLDLEEKLSPEEQELLIKHPPCIHIGSDTHRIAIEGVDLSLYLRPHALPQELTAVTAPPGKLRHIANFSSDLESVVKLEKLAAFCPE